jgi:zinc protease
VVAGDFDPKATLARIEQLFSAIPSHGKPKDPGAPGFDANVTTLTKEVRETVEDEVELPRSYLVWQSPKHFAPGDAELDLLATVLASGRASRLYRALVDDQKIAQSVEVAQSSGTLGSRFVVEVTARPGVSLDKLEAALDRELEKVRVKNLEGDELTRAKNMVDASFVARIQGVRERAALLNSYEAEMGDPGYIDRDRARYQSANAEGIRSVASKVLAARARVVLRIVPKMQKPKQETK